MEHEANLEYARRNEDMLRGANSGLERDAEADGDDPRTTHLLLCECAEACGGTVTISFTEWDDVHRSPNRFVVAPGHEDPAVEQIVARDEHYVTVEKPPAS
jgi:hypothetical protein